MITRIHSRYIRVILTACTSFLSRGSSYLVSLVSIPWLSRYLSREELGVWFAISSFILIFSFLAFGLGNGLLNVVSRSHGANQLEDRRRYISSTFFFLFAVSVVLGVVGALIIPFLHISCLLRRYSSLFSFPIPFSDFSLTS